jgi:hypothetical protein
LFSFVVDRVKTFFKYTQTAPGSFQLFPVSVSAELQPWARIAPTQTVTITPSSFDMPSLPRPKSADMLDRLEVPRQNRRASTDFF